MLRRHLKKQLATGQYQFSSHLSCLPIPNRRRLRKHHFATRQERALSTRRLTSPQSPWFAATKLRDRTCHRIFRRSPKISKMTPSCPVCLFFSPSEHKVAILKIFSRTKKQLLQKHRIQYILKKSLECRHEKKPP